VCVSGSQRLRSLNCILGSLAEKGVPFISWQDCHTETHHFDVTEGSELIFEQNCEIIFERHRNIEMLTMRNRARDHIVGHNIQRLRVHTRTGRPAIFSALGVSSSTLTKLEKGDQSATDEQLRIISDVCGAPFHPSWYGENLAKLDGAFVPQTAAIEGPGEAAIFAGYVSGRSESLMRGDIVSLDPKPFLDCEYTTYSPPVPLKHITAQRHRAFRTADLTMSRSEAGGYAFQYGQRKNAKRMAEIYFRGAVLPSNDRFFLIGYDAINFLDWVLLVLIPLSHSMLVGIETVTSSEFVGARRVALRSADRCEAKLEDALVEWLDGRHEPAWVSGQIAEFRKIAKNYQH
jgi:transcriptional regulator with XRE-family HTH domain